MPSVEGELSGRDSTHYMVTDCFGFPGDGVRHERVPYPDKIFVKRMVIRSYGLAAQL